MDACDTDWWDRRVYDSRGELLGVVVGVYDSERLGRPGWLAIGMGAFGLRLAVVPVEGALLWGADVVVAHDRATILAAPPGDLDVTIAADDEIRLLAHYSPTIPTGGPVRPPDRKHTT